MVLFEILICKTSVFSPKLNTRSNWGNIYDIISYYIKIKVETKKHSISAVWKQNQEREKKKSKSKKKTTMKAVGGFL